MPLLAVLLAGLGLGCAATVDAAFDAGEDFSRFHVWDWEPAHEPEVEASGQSEVALEAKLRRLIRGALAARGYVHGRERPDFFVRYALSLVEKVEVVQVPRAPYLLSSLSSSPSYWVWGSDSQERRYEDLRLAIDVSAGSGRLVWRAAMRERLEHGRRARLGSAVTSLIERFPRASPRPRQERSPGDQLALLEVRPDL